MGSGLARSVCEYVDGSRCADLSYIIQAGLTLVYYAAAHYSGAIPEGLPTKRQVDGSQDYVRLWETMLSSSGDISYDSLAPLSFHSDDATLTRRQGEPSLVHRLQVAGFTLDNSPKHDIIANHMTTARPFSNCPFQEGVLTQMLLWAPICINDSISRVSKSRSLLERAAATWAVYADNASHKMNDFIGFAETEHAANFYYRIIPEIRGFGTNYETVDVCGGMASYL
ncbi:uncharacterized protein P174DRAFT_507133 [Aspergillus novofumigatus IBT 16806]|uniref:Uncharacterized protein n=1 Tax=Aspergillus novofumigatus (strain IBT 16806) TaxID=1392255 RepID=A0A2I1BYG6_ASPN1|nr:uncharacterized protein P174DRAFT_507133 [Aspergillus novofumigatus IBT 16806]PKX90416.1 hypothetical protein P174DRAFT_507133 [Aspergillus novofumigatus IBT 16806]